jgi:HEAT repeat protein
LIGPEMTPLLIPLLTAERAEARQTAAYVLGDYGPEAREALPALFSAAGDNNEAVRAAAVTALGRVARDPAGTLTPAARDALTAALNDPSAEVRRAAREALDRRPRRP